MEDKDYLDDIDALLWAALDRAFWAYAARMQDIGEVAVTDKLAQEVTAYLEHIRDQEGCYDE